MYKFVSYFYALCFSSVILSQTQIAINSFEQTNADTWTPITFSTPPCANGADQWDHATILASISPNHLF